MKRIQRSLLILLPLAAVTGCDALGTILDFLQPRTVTVELVNDSPDFDVDVVMYYDEDQDTIESLLTELGTRVDRTVGPGETSSFTRDCDDLQAVIIDDADLRIVGGLGPEDSTDVLRDGTDFGCGDTITFTFAHSATLVDFAIDIDVR